MAHWSGTRSGWNERGRPNDMRQKLIEKQEAHQREQMRMLEAIRSRMDPAEYEAWFDATPEDNAGFNKAVIEKHALLFPGQ